MVKTPLEAPQYRVIDALDECGKYQELFTFLAGERPSFPLRLFLTSRMVSDMKRLQQSLQPPSSLVCIEIPPAASVSDIQLYIGNRIHRLDIGGGIGHKQLANIILGRAHGCFLWVRLVLEKLENAYSSDDVIKAIEGMPEGMSSYYERTVSAMSTAVSNKYLTKAILLWATMGTRKLTLDELSHALKLDIDAVLSNAKNAVEGLCGQLVAIDRESGLVGLVHPTAREFLLSEATGEFAVTESAAHERISLACLQLLSSNELRPPRHPRLLSRPRPAPSPLLEYALTQFSEHITSAPLESGKLLDAMEQFFTTNVLSWVERLSAKGNLHALYFNRQTTSAPTSTVEPKAAQSEIPSAASQPT